MSTASTFGGSVPRVYHEFLGPMIFEPYAHDTAARLAPRAGERILELACGTGIVTKEILGAIGAGAGGSGAAGGASLTATDLSQGMIDVALEKLGPPRAGLTFQPADACSLPFADASFDAIACQFGVMFFPDKEKAMREARRVLKPGGRYVFNVWGSFEHNPVPRIVHETCAAALGANPPSFLARLPYGHHDPRELERIVRAGGFRSVEVAAVDFPCVAPAAEDAARGFIEGTPLRAELAERGVNDPSELRGRAARTLAGQFGDRPCRATMRAIVVTAR